MGWGGASLKGGGWGGACLKGGVWGGASLKGGVWDGASLKGGGWGRWSEGRDLGGTSLKGRVRAALV